MDVILFGNILIICIKTIFTSFYNVSIFFCKKKLARPRIKSLNLISKFIGETQFGQHKLDA